MRKVGFYYEVSPMAKMAHDGVVNSVKAYMQIKLELKTEPNETEYETLKEMVKKLVFQQTNIEVEHLKSISKEEYDANHEED